MARYKTEKEENMYEKLKKTKAERYRVKGKTSKPS